MFIDGRSIDRDVTTDVCIVGAGPAGITLALELRGRGLRVALLESGGRRVQEEYQKLAIGELAGRDYHPLWRTRARVFGGTTEWWGGYCLRLDPSDFEARSWVPHSGWPFPASELAPYYPRAEAICRIEGRSFDPVPGDATLALPAGRIESRAIVFSRARFGSAYAQTLRQAADVRVLLHTTATSVDTDPDGRRVERISAATLGGARFHVRARAYVLAAGAIENARLLLASRGATPRGVGNPHDLVGRYFMEHPMVWSGILLAPIAPRFLGFYDRRAAGRQGYLAVSEDVRRQERLLNAGMMLMGIDQPTFFRPEKAAVDPVWRPLAATLPALVSGGSAVQERVLWSIVEQSPNPESRVTLSKRRDAFGQPLARLDWRVSEGDLASLRRSQEILAEDLGRAGAGRLRVTVPDDEGSRIARGGHHHMGTTRMHDDPKRGVVDARSRVHGVANLYVAGSSVFPTSGAANPTLTLVALAVRLAGHLREELPG